MATWARIEDSKVVELTTEDPTGRFAPDLVWVSCPDGTGERDTYDAETQTFTAFVLPEPPTPVIEEGGAATEGENLADPEGPIPE